MVENLLLLVLNLFSFIQVVDRTMLAVFKNAQGNL